MTAELKGSRWARFWESRHNDEEPETAAWERRENEMLADAWTKSASMMIIIVVVMIGTMVILSLARSEKKEDGLGQK